MNRLVCKQCDSEFFSSSSNFDFPCPDCGYLHAIDSASDRRIVSRSKRIKDYGDCEVLKGAGSHVFTVVDISETGVGIRRMGELPFTLSEKVCIYIGGQLTRRAEVVWTKNARQRYSRAGLRFC